MNCKACESTMTVRQATVGNQYRYTLSGLSNVFLCGIEIRECQPCNLQVPIIPRVPELHKVISQALVSQIDPLHGDQIRFLRKYLGIPAREFAVLLQITPEHLSRVERGHIKHLGRTSDASVKNLVMKANGQEDTLETLRSIAKAKLRLKASSNQPKPRRPVFKLVSNHWKAA